MARRSVERIDVDPSGALVFYAKGETVTDRERAVLQVPVADLRAESLDSLADAVLPRVPEFLEVSREVLRRALGELRAACAGEEAPAESSKPPPRRCQEQEEISTRKPESSGDAAAMALWVRAMDGTRHGPFNAGALRSARKLKLKLAEQLQTFSLGITLLDGAQPLDDDSDFTSLSSDELQLLVSSGRPAVVVARVRPMSRREVQADEREAVAVTDKATLLLTDSKGREHAFTFDSVFARDAPQEEVGQIVEPALTDALNGISSTFVAFGARGAGKTFTLLGSLLRPDGPGPGWIPHFCQRLFAKLQEEDEPYLTGVSMFSMHREELRDLLRERDNLLRLKQGVEGVGLPDLSWHVASSPEQILELLQQGLSSIQVACTTMEIQSSEVSTFFQLHIVRFAGSLAGLRECYEFGLKERQLKRSGTVNEAAMACTMAVLFVGLAVGMVEAESDCPTMLVIKTDGSNPDGWNNGSFQTDPDTAVTTCESQTGDKHTSEHDNSLYFQTFPFGGDANIVSFVPAWYGITQGQPVPWDCFKTDTSSFTFTAGRKASVGVRDAFLSGMSTPFNILASDEIKDGQIPYELNFVVEGDISFVLECHESRFGPPLSARVRFAQGHHSATNNWWVGGPDCTLTISHSLNCGSLTFTMDSSDQFEVSPLAGWTVYCS
eukprot:s2955_g1.t1